MNPAAPGRPVPGLDAGAKPGCPRKSSCAKVGARGDFFAFARKFPVREVFSGGALDPALNARSGEMVICRSDLVQAVTVERQRRPDAIDPG